MEEDRIRLTVRKIVNVVVFLSISKIDPAVLPDTFRAELSIRSELRAVRAALSKRYRDRSEVDLGFSRRTLVRAARESIRR